MVKVSDPSAAFCMLDVVVEILGVDVEQIVEVDIELAAAVVLL